MPSYRIPASLYIESENVHAALQTATKYLDDAAHDLASEAYPGLVAVDVDTHLAEECPPFGVEVYWNLDYPAEDIARILGED